MQSNNKEPDLEGVAIIGVAGRFPGARNVAEFWKNIKNGVESISHFSDDELEVTVPSAAQSYVKARSILDGVDLFDAAFFGIHPQEAKLIDPQHRIFLECCWEALEDAGYDPGSGAAVTGVFAGCSPNSYFLTQVCQDPSFIKEYAAAYQVGLYSTMLGAIADTLATRIAYKLNLRGPAVTLLSACSTSLVAVNQACSNLLSYQCDMALAGGVSITLPQKRGYLYEPGGMVSPDGHCRAFDADAQGTVFGSGAGVVLLKRLEEAVADGDHIYAVIKGSAVNNDGSRKVGFTAPSVEGQAAAIALAQASAGVEPASISYVEAHGTATPLGDPIEFSALKQVFAANTQERGFCAIGTAKTNVGHLDVAAGVTGLIKATLSLKEKVLPPLLHFRQPNPKLDLENSPFYINTELRPWTSRNGTPLRAGISAFGVGGTNAHAVLEEAPPRRISASSRTHHLLCLSAKSEAALHSVTSNLAEHLIQHPGINLADVSFTLNTGRRAMNYRKAIVCNSATGAIQLLQQTAQSKPILAANSPACVHFLFPGQGAQSLNMGAEFYRGEPVFHAAVDRCADILLSHLKADLREILYSGRATSEAEDLLNQTQWAQPALFVTEYALAQLWMSWGIEPQAMAGHSVGEFVAATLAGVFSLEDALALVAGRAQLMQSLPRGAMLSVRLSEEEITPLLEESLSVAAVNAPHLVVAAGPFEAIDNLEKVLAERKVPCRRLRTSHAFHSQMVDGILDPLTDLFRQKKLAPPRIPFLSCVTGTWITEQEATDPHYWAQHCRRTVRFSDAVSHLRHQPQDILLEIGPGNALQTLARQHPGEEQIVLSTLTGSRASQSETESTLNALGRLWQLGIIPDWKAYYRNERCHRLSLPTYPFERKSYWVDRAPETQSFTQNEGEQQPTASTLLIKKDVTPQMDRKTSLVSTLVSILQELSGLDPSAIHPGAHFLELGFDSLFLTQVTQSLQSRFHLKVTFRQLLGQLSSVNALAEYLDEQLPATEFQPKQAKPEHPAGPSGAAPRLTPATIAEPSFATTNKPMPEEAIERIVKEQWAAFSQLAAKQLESLRASGGSTSSTSLPFEQTSTTLPVSASEPAPTKQEFKTFGPYKPFQKDSSGGLTPHQQTYLNKLIARYTARTQGSKVFTQKYRKVLADPRVASGFRSQWKEMVYPIVTNRSNGSRLWDIDGNEYIDLLNGFGPIAFGHIPDFISHAITDQLKEGIEIGPQTPLAGEVAELLCEITGMERATFCNTGSEAVMAAIRIARTVTGKKKVVLFAGDYHGNFDEVLVKKLGKQEVPRSGPIAPGITTEATANMIVLDYGSPDALATIQKYASDIAAVLVEPIQSRHPALQPRGFLGELREITAHSEIALIFDEIVTGFRVHLGGAQAYYGIRADMATYGKVLGGGLPIGALAGSARFMDALDGGTWSFGDESFPEAGVTFFAGTFVRHPLALAASRAVLKYLKAEGPQLQERLTQRTTQLIHRINTLFERYSVPSRLESCGSFFYFGFPSEFPYGSLLYYHLREKGIHILEGFPCFLTTAHTDADLDRVVRAFEESLQEMQQGGILPTAAFSEPEEAPLTEAQLEIWLSSRLSEEAACAFNESISLTLGGELNQKALFDAIQELVNRHQALRATFDTEGRLVRFQKQLQLDIPVIDLTSQHTEERNKHFDLFLRKNSGTPFDLSNGPLIRATLVRLEAQSHVLVFTAHHIICDGWSMNILTEELSALYSAKCKGTPLSLATPLPFGVYAKKQQESLATTETATAEAYWVGKFSELPPLLDLPVDRPRPAVKAFTGATVRRTIGADLYQKYKATAARHSCTLFAFLLAGFEALLFRLTNQDDVVVGVPTAGQSFLEGKSLVGHCVNFLPLRGIQKEDSTFADLLSVSKRELIDAYEHRNYTYGTLVRKLEVVRDPSRLPLVEVQFNLDRASSTTRFHDLEAKVDANPKSFVNFDLFLNVTESPDGLVLDCDYNSYLFHRETVERWLTHYETLLSSVADDPSQLLSAVPLLSPDERQNLISSWNHTKAEYPSRCIHELIEAQADLTPSAIAAVFNWKQLSYTDLNKRANQLAHYLKQYGVGRNERIAICLERSLDMLVALLAVLKCGASYVPLDPALPHDRLHFIIEEANTKAVLTQERVALGLTGIGSRLICVDTDWELIGKENTTNPSRFAQPEDIAYVIYTSGSTGKPKGVKVSHRAVVNFLWSMTRQPGFDATDRLLAVTTLSFDIAGLEMFLPLVSGAQVVIADRETTIDGHRMANLIQEARITVLQATPATWRLLLEAGWTPPPRFKILCGGEALPRTLANELLKGGAELWNMYGPTETTIWSAVSKVAPGDDPITIGPPIDNTQFHVVDRNGHLSPMGIPGELYIGGDGVADGYFQRPELTAEKFIPDPFHPGTHARLYKTGDLVRRLPNGHLEFLGRLDFQVKVRGFRIELGEIESVISQHPQVRETIVLAVEDQPGDTRLTAYVASPNAATISDRELREFVSQKLPSYMVPSFFVFMDSLPKTPNGKLNRKAVKPPQGVKGRQEREHVQPRNPIEEKLARICADVLCLDRVSVEDNLFELGADSIRVFQISARAMNEGVHLTAQQLLHHRTIAKVSEVVASVAAQPEKVHAPLSISRAAREKYRITNLN